MENPNHRYARRPHSNIRMIASATQPTRNYNSNSHDNEKNNYNNKDFDDFNSFPYPLPVTRTTTSSLQYRMCIGLNVEENQSRHNKYVSSQLQKFRNYQKKQDEAYLRTQMTEHKIPGLGQRVQDRFVIESISEARNKQWRTLVLEDHIEPVEASQISSIKTIGRIKTDRFISRSVGVVPSDIPKKLPKESTIIKKSRQQRRTPVLYWGCGNY